MRSKFRVVILSLVMAFCSIPLISQPASALSVSDYFSLSYTATISPTKVTSTDDFYFNVTATAACKKDLPLSVSEAQITGDVIGKNISTGDVVMLNSSYTLDITDFPNKAGQSYSASQSVPLQFPSGSPDGKYTISGEIIEAKVKYGLWVDVTGYLPQNKNFGTVTYSSGSDSGSGGGGGGNDNTTPTPTVTASHTPTPTPSISQPAAVDVTGGNILDYLNSEGVTKQALVAHSDDRTWNININQETKIHLVDNNLGQINLTQVTVPSSNAAYIKILDKVYELNPSGMTFDPPVSLTVSYNPDSVPIGLSADKLTIGQWDTNNSIWIPLPCTVDTTTHIITTALNHFSQYTILVYTRPAKFVLSDFSVNPDNANTADPVIIKVSITNSGDLAGAYDMVFRINNVDSGDRKITLAGGENQVVSFTTSFNSTGYYTLSLGSMVGQLVIESPTNSQTPGSGTVAETASFAFSDLHINPINITYGKDAKGEFTITNTSQQPGTCTIELKLDSTVVDSKDVTLNAGDKQIETFNIANAAIGQHMVEVNGITASFSVTKPQPMNNSKPLSIRLLIILVAAVIAILVSVIALLVIRRRKKIINHR